MLGSGKRIMMERRFSIEAKSFCFSAKEGSLDLRLEERRKGSPPVGSSEVSMEWVSSLIPELAMVVPSDVPPVSVVRQSAPVLTDSELGFGVSLGATDVGFGSSLVVWQIFSMSPDSLVVVSSAVAFRPASHWCGEREDSLPVVIDPVLSPASVEANAVWNLSPAMDLIIWGTFGLSVTSPSRSVEKEASL